MASVSPKICLNMIVRSEAARIERCLLSVVDYIDCYSIADTGSTDGTQDLIVEFFAKRNIPGEIHQEPFVNFAQARNLALDHARNSVFDFDYVLLMDADMELKVEDPEWKSKLTGPVYDVCQKGGGLDYFNVRLLKHDTQATYVSPTHEYLSHPGNSTRFEGIWFVDHADGSNRPGKFQRDIQMLLDDLKIHPDSVRSTFYLAQSYRDAGKLHMAAKYYKKRAEMGGWDEEAWYARLMYGRCLLHIGSPAEAIRELLAAYSQRPWRAEPLHDLAKYYREKEAAQAASLIFSEAGMKVPYPVNDVLFVETFSYTAGFREEFSIAAFYDQSRRKRGFAVCNELALDRAIPDGTRELARTNLFHYLQPLKDHCPSYQEQQIPFYVPDGGWVPMNPSVVTRRNGDVFAIVRCVNYHINEQGQYEVIAADGTPKTGEAAYWVNNPIRTKNFLVKFTPDGDVFQHKLQSEILNPLNMPEPLYKLVIGFEDMRLFEWDNDLWFSATVREMSQEGYCEQVVGHIVYDQTGCHIGHWHRMLPEPRRGYEKNWMPWPDQTKLDGNKLEFAYKLNENVDYHANTTHKHDWKWACEHISGGSQVIPFEGGWIALVHEARISPYNGQRYYQHRFVWFDHNRELKQISMPFYFRDKVIEFAAGLAWHPDRTKLIISYGFRDREAVFATVGLGELREFLWHGGAR